MALSEALRRVGDRVASFYTGGGDAPYQLYVYNPEDEWAVRRELQELRLWLEAPPRGIHCASISLANLFWDALADHGWIDSVVAGEKEAAADGRDISETLRAVAEILRQPPTLPDRVLSAVERLEADTGGARTAVFLYRAGALYPAYRTSALLEDLLGRLPRPVTLLYPGTVVGEGLRFMGVCEPTYGYRAHKVLRGN